MQKIKVSAKSELARGLIEATHNANHQTIVSVKTTSGDSIYRGLISRWECVDDVLEVTLEDWDKYWGEMMARKYGA